MYAGLEGFFVFKGFPFECSKLVETQQKELDINHTKTLTLDGLPVARWR